MTEFNLSEKIIRSSANFDGFDKIYIGDVKEFIRLLKENYRKFGTIFPWIDALAGEKLT